MNEQANKTLETQNLEVNSKKKPKKKTSKIIINIISSIIFIVIILEIIVGVVNMNRISNDQEPIWYLNEKTIETDLKTETIYNLGLYKIVKTDTSKKTKITLKPFFIGN